MNGAPWHSFAAVGKKAEHEKGGIPGHLARRITAHAQRLQHGPETDRTVFFSDAVFAIAMTLLALDLKLPAVPSDISEQGLNDVLRERLPSLISFALSFVLVARAWLTHHHHFNAIAAYDNKLQVRNLVMLFFVVFLPVPTALLFQPGPTTPWTPAIYALTLAGLNLSLRWTWAYARHAGLMQAWLDEPLYKSVLRTADPVWAVFLLSIPVAFISPSAGMYSWILIWPASMVHGRLRRAKFAKEEAALYEAGMAGEGSGPGTVID